MMKVKVVVVMEKAEVDMEKMMNNKEKALSKIIRTSYSILHFKYITRSQMKMDWSNAISRVLKSSICYM